MHWSGTGVEVRDYDFTKRGPSMRMRSVEDLIAEICGLYNRCRAKSEGRLYVFSEEGTPQETPVEIIVRQEHYGPLDRLQEKPARYLESLLCVRAFVRPAGQKQSVRVAESSTLPADLGIALCVLRDLLVCLERELGNAYAGEHEPLLPGEEPDSNVCGRGHSGSYRKRPG